MLREWSGGALLAVASLALLLLAGEILVRWWFPPADFGDDRKLAQRFHPHRKLRYASAFGEYDVSSTYNSVGMRDREHPARKPPGSRRIVVIGDSYVEAKMVPVEETFPAELERLLADSGPVDVINAGHSGFGSMEEHLVLRHFGMGREPDLVVQAFVMNDPADDWEDRDSIEWDAAGPLRLRGFQSELALFVADRLRRLPFVWKRKTVDRDALGRLEDDPFWAVRPGSDLASDERWARTLGALEASARLCREHGVAYLLIVVPLAAQVDSAWRAVVEDPWKLHPELVTVDPQARLARFAADKRIAVLDLIPVLEPFADEELYYPRDAHWTPRAHRIVAEALADLIEATDWRPPPGPVRWPLGPAAADRE